MGAWGALAFDNDDACDWAGDLDAVKDFSLVEAAFDTVESAAYIEAPDASNALAACEVVARAAGRGGYQNSYTEGVDAWVARVGLKPSPALLRRSLGVITRILGDKSELRELWDDSENPQEWRDAVEELRRRLA